MACTTQYILIEILFVNLPSFLFIVAGAINFKYVRSIGFNRVVKFSNWFKFKILLCWNMIAIDLLVAIMATVQFSWWEFGVDNGGTSPDDPMLCKTFNNDTFGIVYVVLKLINALVWYSSIKLLIYQYRKGLSEVWYSHKMFWVLHVAANLYALVYGVYSTNYKVVHISIKAVEILIQLVLIVLMFKTVTRTAEKPRQGLVMSNDGTLIGSMDLDLFRASSGHAL